MLDLRKNLSLKITAFLISFGLWAWVAGQGDLLKTVIVPLDLSALPPGLEIVSDVPEDVSVRLRGPEIALRTLSPERVRLTVAMANLQLAVGKNPVSLRPDQVVVPAGIEVDRVTPSMLEVELERKATREVDVVPEIRGEPAEGYEIAGTLTQPPRFVIEGPEPAVRTIESLTTPAISIDGVSDNQRLRLRPIPIGPMAHQVRLADPTADVQVLVRVRPIQMERTLAEVALVIRGEPVAGGQPQLDPTTVQVRVNGPRSRVEGMESTDLIVIFDLSELTPADTEVDSGALIARPVNARLFPADTFEFVVVGPPTIGLVWETDTEDESA